MKIRKILFTTVLLFISLPRVINCITENNKITINNGSIRRIIEHTDGRIFTSGLFLNGNDRNYVGEPSPEFRFSVNDREINGFTGWEVVSSRQTEDQSGGTLLLLDLKGNEGPGVLKRTVFHSADRNADIGLTSPGQRAHIKKRSEWMLKMQNRNE